MIPFNKPHLTGKETHYIYDAVNSGKLSGNGKYTKKSQAFFEEKFGFKKTLLTTSCTDALEMAAILLNITEGDEVIVPSYTFVSTALAFVRQGAQIVFADSRSDHPGIDETLIENLITPKTKAIVVVHYAGVACNMDVIMQIAKKHNIFVVEDAAQAIDSYYNDRPLGGIGHLGVFSFHETKNIISGEGGLLAINDSSYEERAEIIWEKGTNRSAFFKGEIDKYGWVDTGSSFLPSELISAFLYAQLEHLKDIQDKRIRLWNIYFENLKDLQNENLLKLPKIPEYATNNAHMFYVVTKNLEERDNFIRHLRENDMHAVFHYLSLHTSKYYLKNHPLKSLPWSDEYSNCLVRLPLFYELEEKQVRSICKVINEFFNK